MLLLDPIRLAKERARLRRAPLMPLILDGSSPRREWYIIHRAAARRFIDAGLENGRFTSIDAPLAAVRRVLAVSDEQGRSWAAFNGESFANEEPLALVELSTAFIRHLAAEGRIDAFIAAGLSRRFGQVLRRRRLVELRRAG